MLYSRLLVKMIKTVVNCHNKQSISGNDIDKNILEVRYRTQVTIKNACFEAGVRFDYVNLCAQRKN